jgi:uncharacterized ferritin-like protein (DUF455 family)
MASLTEKAIAILETASPQAKADASRAAVRWWHATPNAVIARASPPCRPARPERPQLLPPKQMPKRRYAGTRGRVALLHAVAHIELNAIDLAWDLIARFEDIDWPRDFYDDWTAVADDEARHFSMLRRRLIDLGADYGDLPAHDGLWEAAEATAGDPLARLAVVPMILEARGLDVTPQMIARLERAGDDESVAVLQMIMNEEIAHVAAGRRWFEWLCKERHLEPVTTWRKLVSEKFRGNLKPPFNHDARKRAGFSPLYLENL